MRYRIAYDQPGRLRVRFGPDAFTQEQGYGIAALLLGRPGVREAVTCALNGSVLVCYEGEGRAEALAVLRGLRRDALPYSGGSGGTPCRWGPPPTMTSSARWTASFWAGSFPWPPAIS